MERTEELVIEESSVDTGTNTPSQLIVFNDDVNTFEYVIQCFKEILGHTHAQAEQLSLIIHFKGKATVKTAPKPELKPKKEALEDRGLSASIDG